jgi:putrescine transport system substrate-binding protein
LSIRRNPSYFFPLFSFFQQEAWNLMKKSLIAVLFVTTWLMACGGEKSADAPQAAPAASADEQVVNVYNWSDYMGETTLEDFTKATGIKVVYDVYDSNDVLEAKLMAGKSGYDVVFPSAQPNGARQIKAGLLQPLDKSKLSLWSNLDESILKSLETVDPGNAYLVPYMWGTSGIGYNVDKVQEILGENAPVDSWALMFDSESAKKLSACGIAILDEAAESIPSMLAWLGRDPRSLEPGDLDAAIQAFAAVRPYIKYFHSSQYINDLANGDICVAMGYSGDVQQAADRAEEAGKGINIAYSIPSEGAQVATDVMAIPKDAPHPDNAHTFINFLLQPEVIAPITNYVVYPNANKAATELVDEEIRNDPGVYPPAEVQQRLFVVLAEDPKATRELNRAWTSIKTGH